MKRRWKHAVSLIVAMTAFFAVTLNVSAEGVKDVFDAKYYADTYPDLKAAYGYDEAALYKHYMQFGLAEGRVGSPDFNVAGYRKANPDLEAAFGNDWDAYVNHYFKFGKAEGRAMTATGSAKAADSTGTAGQQIVQQTSASYIQHGSKFYDTNWTAIATQNRTWFGNESYYEYGSDDISVYNDAYWTSTTNGAPEGYEIWALKGAVRPHAKYEKAISVVEKMNTCEQYKAGWEAADTVKKSVKHKSSSGEGTLSVDDTFAVEVGGVRYGSCSVHIDIENTKTSDRRNVMNYTVRACLPKGYKEFTATMLNTNNKNPLVAYMPLP